MLKKYFIHRYCLLALFVFTLHSPKAWAQQSSWQQVQTLSTTNTYFVFTTSIGLFVLGDTNFFVFSSDKARTWKTLPSSTQRPVRFIVDVAESRNNVLLTEYLNLVTRSPKDSLLLVAPQDISLPQLSIYGDEYRYQPKKVVANDSLIFIVSAYGLFRSINEGMTFDKVSSVIDTYTINQIHIDQDKVWFSSQGGIAISYDKGLR